MTRSVALALAAPRATWMTRTLMTRSWMTRSWMTRSLIGGAVWGLALTAGLTGMSFAQCGGACIDTTAMTAAASIAAGIVAVGGLTAFARGAR